MQTIRLIENIHLEYNGLYAMVNGDKSRMILRCGELNSVHQVYSFLILLILQGIISLSDILDKECDNALVRRIKSEILPKVNTRPLYDWTFAKLLRKISDRDFEVKDYTTLHYPKVHRIEKKLVKQFIKEQIDKGIPVLVSYLLVRDQRNYSAVIVGYSYSDNCMRLYCIDPSKPQYPYCFWNNIIDLEYTKQAIPDGCITDSYGAVIIGQVLCITNIASDSDGSLSMEDIKQNAFPTTAELKKMSVEMLEDAMHDSAYEEQYELAALYKKKLQKRKNEKE